jgi:hypothetical protein
MNKEQPNKNDVQFMKVKSDLNDWSGDFILSILARKYAELKKIRHNRTGKQQSLDDDEEDIGM